MRKQNTKAQEKNKNYKMIPTPCAPPTPSYKSTPPPPIYPIPSIICNNNTMGMPFLIRIRQSNKCGSVKNDHLFNVQLGFGASP